MPKFTRMSHLLNPKCVPANQKSYPSEREPSQTYNQHDANALRRALESPTPTTLTADMVIDVQRVYGNRVAQKLIQRAKTMTSGEANAVHRYTDRSAEAATEGYSEEIVKFAQTFQRSSSGGGIFQVAEQKIFARDDIIAASEAQLAAQGSFLQLVADGVPSPGYSWVKVKFRGATRAQQNDDDLRNLATENAPAPATRRDNLLAAIETLMATNAVEFTPGKIEGARDANKSMAREKQTLLKMEHPGANDMFLTIRDCHKTARTIMGDLGPTRKRERMIISDTDGTIKKILPDKSRDKEIFSTDGQTGAVAFLKFAFSKFGAVMRAANPDKIDLIGRVDGIAAAWNYTAAMAVYEAIQKDPVIGPLFNRTFKVNDEARVAVGQALVQVNDENERASSVAGTLIDPQTAKNKDLWNFHWAGVVLMDGADYVTLQAVADQMATGLTVNWWFKMYGSGAQSFHSEEKKDPHVGSRPLTLAVSAEAEAPARSTAGPGARVGTPPIPFKPPTSVPTPDKVGIV